MTSALNAISVNKISIAAAAREFNVPRATLTLKVKGWKNRPSTENAQKAGRKTVLSDEIELKLVDAINVLNKWGFSLCKSEILDLVRDYITQNNIQTPFINNRPGTEWWLRFKTRHNLSIRKPELMESSRTRQAGDPFIVMNFYDKLEQILKDSDLLDKPKCIWNANETSLNHDPGITKIVARKGDAAKRQTAGSGRENTTILACGNADGQMMPPAILFKGKITFVIFLIYC